MAFLQYIMFAPSGIFLNPLLTKTGQKHKTTNTMSNSNDAANAATLSITIDLAKRATRTAKTKWNNKLNPDERESRFIINLEGLTADDFVTTFVDQSLIKFRSRVNASGTSYEDFRTEVIGQKIDGVSLNADGSFTLKPAVWARQERALSVGAKTLKLINTPDQAKNAAEAALMKGKVLMFTSMNGREPNADETRIMAAEVAEMIRGMFPEQ